MKTITEITDVKIDYPEAGMVTIVGRVEDKTFSSPGQCNTAQEICAGNKRWYRGHRVTEEAVSMFRNSEGIGIPKVTGFAILQKCISKIGVLIENFLTWSPIIIKQPEYVEINTKETCSFSIEVSTEFQDEMPVTYQWFETLDGKTGRTLDEGGSFSGTKTSTLKIEAGAGHSGAGYFCVATNGGGSTKSQDARLILSVMPEENKI